MSDVIEPPMNKKKLQGRRKVSREPTLFSSNDYIAEVEQLFPLPPSFRKNDQHDFAQLRGQIFKSIEPENFIEAVYANEMSHLLWKIRRNRVATDSLIANARVEGLLRLLVGRCDDLLNLVEGVRRHDDDAQKRVTLKLEALGLTEVDVEVQTRAALGVEIERLERDSDMRREQFDLLAQNFEKRRLIIIERLRRSAEFSPPTHLQPSPSPKTGDLAINAEKESEE